MTDDSESDALRPTVIDGQRQEARSADLQDHGAAQAWNPNCLNSTSHIKTTVRQILQRFWPPVLVCRLGFASFKYIIATTGWRECLCLMFFPYFDLVGAKRLRASPL
jgi:hypothetical protein